MTDQNANEVISSTQTQPIHSTQPNSIDSTKNYKPRPNLKDIASRHSPTTRKPKSKTTLTRETTPLKKSATDQPTRYIRKGCSSCGKGRMTITRRTMSK